jgi:hypothetical protein
LDPFVSHSYVNAAAGVLEGVSGQGGYLHQLRPGRNLIERYGGSLSGRLSHEGIEIPSAHKFQ